MAAPTPTRIQTLVDDVDRTVYATGTYTPTANRLLVAFIVGTHATTASDPTGVTGNGLTWSKKAGVTPTTVSTSVWVVDSGASPTNAAMSITFSGAHTGCLVAIYEVANTDRTGTALAAIIQAPVLNPGAAGTTGSITLAAPASGLNRYLSAFTHAANEATTPRTAFPPWTEDYDTGTSGLAAPTGALEVQKLDTTDLTASASWTTSSVSAGIAIEIAAALTVTTDMTRVVDASATAQFAALGGGAAGLTLQTDFFIQGINCVSKNITGAGTLKGMWTNLGANLDFSDAGAHIGKHIYVWVFNGAPGSCDTRANGGVQIILGDSTGTTTPTNYGAYYVDGSDTLIVGGWKRYCIDPTKQPSLINGTYAGGTPGTAYGTNVRFIGVMFKTTQAIAGQNMGVDAIDYGFGLKATGSSTDLWNDILAADIGSQYFRWGIIQQTQGVLFVRGRLSIGDSTGTLATTVSDTSKSVIFEYLTYALSGADTALIKTTHFQLIVAGNATGATSFTDGIIVGSGDTARGRSGSSFTAVSGASVKADFSSSNLNTFKLYGTILTLISQGVLFRDAGGTAHEFIGCTVDRCGQVNPGRVIVRNVTISGTTAAAALLWNNNINIKNCNFLANIGTNIDAIKHPLAISASYVGLVFSGNDYDIDNAGPTFSPAVTLAEDIALAETDWDVNNASGVAVNDYGKVDSEIVQVTVITSNTLTVTRAQLGTAEATHSSSATFTKVLVISVTGGGTTSPTFEDTSTSVHALTPTVVTLTVTVKDTSGVAVNGARVRIETSGGTLISNGNTNSSGVYSNASYSYGGDVAVNIIVRLKGYINFKTTGTIESSGLNVGVRFIKDDIVDLP